MAPAADPATVAGLAESRLSPADLVALPTGSPAAPWVCRARAITWIQRATTPDFAWAGSPLPLAMVSVVEYLGTPVGTYREVLAGTVLRPGPGVGLFPAVQVPFIAVDSLASVHGGRVNWALPKTMAAFDLDLTCARGQITGERWSVNLAPAAQQARRRQIPDRTPSPGLPLGLRFRAIGPLGRYTTSLRARGRVVRIRSDFEGETLTGWLGSGDHLAVVATGLVRISRPHRPGPSRPS